MNIFIIIICAYTGFTMFLEWITTEDNFTGFQKFDNSSHIMNNKYSQDFTGFQKFDNSSHIVNNKYSHFNYLTHQQCNIKNQYVYDQQTLLSFNEQVGIKILPQTVKLIRSLGLQRKWKHKQRGKRAGRNRGKVIKQTGIWIKCIPTPEFTKNVSFLTANCRSAPKSGRGTQVRIFMIEKTLILEF